MNEATTIWGTLTSKVCGLCLTFFLLSTKGKQNDVLKTQSIEVNTHGVDGDSFFLLLFFLFSRCVSLRLSLVWDMADKA